MPTSWLKNFAVGLNSKHALEAFMGLRLFILGDDVAAFTLESPPHLDACLEDVLLRRVDCNLPFAKLVRLPLRVWIRDLEFPSALTLFITPSFVDLVKGHVGAFVQHEFPSSLQCPGKRRQLTKIPLDVMSLRQAFLVDGFEPNDLQTIQGWLLHEIFQFFFLLSRRRCLLHPNCGVVTTLAPPGRIPRAPFVGHLKRSAWK